ncbi:MULTISPECIES: hypothetical protein [unclassified Oceanispirochaeta]|uniref:hypothetical protein n=1 Tax=unclassified Oceanispirochaeta TaxID=2635722 RepID=UPI000E098742|nr:MULTISPECIES: hypothetical protein [unclassified Oceanispirochaeta]MBF9014963.1 hypothetical protein [Oceanispirochaeta sp. M2]NPD71356.1 hypothetical protein [Oceanispirochaeta sp. M1]RDG33321.1 hypothetical protein DV872_04505 [Oceanispirochaeta sp. M1]
MVVEAPQYNEKISRELNKVLTHSLFKGARRSCSFLRYVCEKTLAGESNQIKEFSIAVDAFGLEMTFDQQIDPRIRVEAKRLRDRLRQYYDGPGCKDPVMIHMEKGSYIPCFLLLDEEQNQEAQIQENEKTEKKSGEIGQSVLMDQRFLIQLDLQSPAEEDTEGINLFSDILTHQLFNLGQKDSETISLTKLIELQNTAFPLILTIRHHKVSDKIHIILRLKLKQSGTLIRIEELSLSISDLQNEQLVKTTVLREAEGLLKFCRSVQL